MEIQDKARTLGELWIEIQIATHLQGHLLTDGKSQSVALRQVVDLEEWLEQIVALFFGNTAAGVGHENLIRVRTALLDIEPDVSACRCVLGGIR